MPLDHFNLCVPEEKLQGVTEFLLKSLEHMGFKEIMRPVPHIVGLGEGYNPYLWLAGMKEEGEPGRLRATHVAFTAKGQSALLSL